MPEEVMQYRLVRGEWKYSTGINRFDNAKEILAEIFVQLTREEYRIQCANEMIWKDNEDEDN